MQSILILVALAIAAVAANLSPFVWGPNVIYLLERERPVWRSLAYTAGRALTLVLASLAVVGAMTNGHRQIRDLVAQATAIASAPGPWLYMTIGVGAIATALWLLRTPDPDILDRFKRTRHTEGKLLPAFGFGISIAIANLFGFVWQVIAIGAVVVLAEGDMVFVAIAVVVWTVFGTIDLWLPALGMMLFPQRTAEWLTRAKERIPTFKPRTIVVIIGLAGLGTLVYGVWKLLG